jgi:hypothetical protein
MPEVPDNVHIRGAGKNRAWHWLCDPSRNDCAGMVQFTRNAKPHL